MRRVYVVDDDESLRKALSFVLKGLDCDPVPYPSAEHFLTYVPHNEPGIVLLDVRMGQMTGLELQQRLIDTGIDWPVIFLSGHGDLEMAVETMMKGAVCFCKNPYVEKNSRKLWIAQQLCPKLKPTSGKPLSTHFHLEKNSWSNWPLKALPCEPLPSASESRNAPPNFTRQAPCANLVCTP